MYDIDTVISILEETNGISLSEEQKAVLKSDTNQALLINAAAGAGKTTIVIMTMIARILTGEILPSDILAITFSKQAQLDMETRYEQYIDKLRLLGITLPPEKPTFSTFHALFYRILRQLPKYARQQVISSPMTYAFQLSKSITHSSDQVLSQSEILENIFNVYQYLINTNISTDGLHLIHSEFKSEDEESFDISELYLMNADIVNNLMHDDLGYTFWQDYVDVITQYEILKANNNQLDFNDMSTLLTKAMDNPFDASLLTSATMNYELLIIDEFQDINKSQWELISRLIMPDTLDKMIAIGDNDQAIYGFRGSSPEFIMTFHDLMPHSQTRNLSTNYRTGGVILEEARKVIEDNQYRLPKELNAFKKGQGEVIIHTSALSPFTESTPFLQTLKSRIEDPTRDTDIAILTRYNADAMLVIDWLAQHNVYLDAPAHLILSHNKLYKSMMTIIYAVYADNADILATSTRYIGFKNFESLFNDAKNQTPSNSLGDVIQTLKSTTTDSRNAKHIENLSLLYDTIQNNINKPGAPLGIAYQALITATSAYYNYMISHHYIVEETFTRISNYLYQTFLNGERKGYSYQQFIDNENAKNNTVQSQYANVENVSISSLHQSKGLEYDEVFMFGLRSEPGEKATINLERQLGYDVDIESLRTLNNSSKTKSLLLTKQFKQLHNTNLNKLLKISKLDMLLTDDRTANEIVNLLHLKFNEIEEERRLIYVGMTRARQTLHLDSFIEMTPLLDKVIHK